MNLKFKVYSQQLSKEKTTNDDLILEGIASTTSLDLDGDYMTRECIESMKKQALSCNIHGNHKYGLDNLIGTVKEVLETDEDTLKIKFKILPSFKEKINELLENGVSLGLSIGGTVLDYDNFDSGWKIKQIQLHEISLTPIPANWDTFGSVSKTEKELTVEGKCLNGVCKSVLKEIGKNKDMTEETIKEVGEEPVTQQQVVDLINEAINEAKDTLVAEIIDELSNFPEEKEKDDKDEVEVEVVDEETETEEKPEEEEKACGDDEDKKDKEINVDSLTEEIMKSVRAEIEAEKEAERLAREEEAKKEAEKEALMKELREEIEADILKDLQSKRKPEKKEYEVKDDANDTDVVKMTTREIAEQITGQQ